MFKNAFNTLSCISILICYNGNSITVKGTGFMHAEMASDGWPLLNSLQYH